MPTHGGVHVRPQTQTTDFVCGLPAQVTEDDYVQVVDAANANREDDAVEARSVEAALSALAVGEATPEDRHPER